MLDSRFADTGLLQSLGQEGKLAQTAHTLAGQEGTQAEQQCAPCSESRQRQAEVQWEVCWTPSAARTKHHKQYATEFHCLTALEAKGLTSRRWQSRFLLGALREHLSPASLLASGGFRKSCRSLADGHMAPFSTLGVTWPSSRVLTWPNMDNCHWISGPPSSRMTSPKRMTSAKVRFPNKVTLRFRVDANPERTLLSPAEGEIRKEEPVNECGWACDMP